MPLAKISSTAATTAFLAIPGGTMSIKNARDSRLLNIASSAIFAGRSRLRSPVMREMTMRANPAPKNAQELVFMNVL
jgi:hypothetical protein